MKELIGTVILIMSTFGAGSIAAREIHDTVRKAAIEKMAQGMPSLTRLTTTLRFQRK